MAIRWSRLVWLAGALGVGYLAGRVGCDRDDGPRTADPDRPAGSSSIRVRVAAVERRTFPASFSAIGTLDEGSRTAVAAPAAGYIAEISVAEGHAVSRGDPLFAVGGSDDRAAVAAAEGELARARMVLEAGGPEDDPALLIAAERAAAAERTIAEAGQRSASARAFAPIDGVVAVWLRGAGNYVAAGEPVIEISGGGTLAAVVAVSEEQARGISPGLVANVAVSPFGRRRGTVVAIDQPASGVVGREVRLEVQNHDQQLQEGLKCEVSFPLGGELSQPCIPIAALLGEGDRKYVFVVQDHRARRRDVSAGAIASGCVAAGEDVEEGEKVVVGGAAGLADGATVQIENE